MDDLSRGRAFFILLIWTITAGLLPANFISAEEKIDINTAPLEELVKIIHIGEARALELTSLRPFSSLDDLARIKGIGPSRIEDIKNQGLAWVGTESDETKSSSAEAAAEEGEEASDSSSSASRLDTARHSLVEESLQQYPEGIIFSEILPSPEGPDEENEWIELYNENGSRIDLSGWKVEDEKGKTKTYVFPEETFIEGGRCLLLPRTVSGIILNNEGDTLKLAQPNGQMADFVSYGKAERGKSFNLTAGEWLWSGSLTPGEPNPTVSEEETAEVSPLGKATAEISQTSSAGEGRERGINLSAGLIALLLASFSGIMILAIKKKASSN